MAKVLAKFNAIPVNPELDPTGGFRIQLKDRQTYDEETVFDEVADKYKLPMPADVLEYLFKCVLGTAAKKTAHDCKIRKIGNLLSIRPTLRGKIKNATDKFGSGRNNKFAIYGKLLSGVEAEVSSASVSFVNDATGIRVKLERISWVGSDEDGVIKVGTAFAAYGKNMQFNTQLGDTAKMEWTAGDGTKKTLAITPTESDYGHMKFAWPTGETVPQADDEVTITIVSRAGIDGNYAQTSTKTVNVVAAS